MIDLDELIRETLADEAGRARFDRTRWEPSVMRLAAPRRPLFPVRRPVRRTLIAVAVAVVLAVAIAGPLVLLSRLGSRTREVGPSQTVTPSPTAPGYVRHADRDDGLSIQIPVFWTFHQDPSGPAQPRTVFAVGSYAFSTGGECAPAAAQRELPGDGALFWVIEWRDPTFEFPARPPSFELDESTHGFYECSVASSYLIRFEDQGRYFQVHVALGEEAPDSVASEVLRALESLEVTAPVPEGCPAGTGPWSDPDCPWSAWTHEVVETAGYEIVDDTGSAFEVGTESVRFYIWNTETDHLPGRPASVRVTEEEFHQNLSDEGYRQQSVVEGVPVFSDGIRTVWVTQGLAVWVEPSALPGSINEPPRLAPETLEALIRASLSIDYDAIDTRP